MYIKSWDFLLEKNLNKKFLLSKRTDGRQASGFNTGRHGGIVVSLSGGSFKNYNIDPKIVDKYSKDKV